MVNTNKLELTDQQLAIVVLALQGHKYDIERTRMHHPERFEDWNRVMAETEETLAAVNGSAK